jgi:hypothetical protein
MSDARQDGRVPSLERPSRRPLTREDLPAELTPEALRHLSLRTLRQFARPDNGVLNPEEQRQFDAALAEVMRGTRSVFNESLERAHRGGPGNLDPALRRSYQRTQQRLATQARRAQDSFPELAIDTSFDPAEAPESRASTTTLDPVDTVDSVDRVDEDLTPDAIEQEVEQTSETLDMLERIASLQQQQLEHQESQLLSETRGFFFAFLVSVAVIIAGVAPLVEAEPHDRLLIVLWTVAAIAVAGLVYALVRGVQVRNK